MGIITLLNKQHSPGASPETASVDIVAVHGLYEGNLQTWTEPQTNVLWLRDLFPHKELDVRVLAYGYRGENLVSPGEGTTDRILPYATSLIAELCAERELSHSADRPIIFICHGFGGILVKRALIFASTSRAKHVEHRRSIYVSTYAILFIGTPHNGMSKDGISGLLNGQSAGSSQFTLNLLKQSEMLRDITDQFAPLMRHFSIYYFWEQVATKTRKVRAYIVDEDSAAPAWDNADRCGIMATHSGMVKFKSVKDPGYSVVYAALRRSIKLAPKSIKLRWTNDQQILMKERQGELEALLQTELPQITYSNTELTNLNKFYTVPRCSSNYFTGRKMHVKILKDKFCSPQDQSKRYRRKIFVIYGLGGSGKTQFCLKYVEENRSNYWGVFWIDASNEENAESGYASLGQQAGKGATFAAGLHWLSSSSKPWFLVIDNADDPDMDVSRYFPTGDKGHILITTRNPGVVTQSTIGDFHFRGMDPEEATTLLLISAHVPNTPENLDNQSRKLAHGIASELGYLALALTNAGATIRRKIYTLDKYLHYYLGYRREMISYPNVVNADDANIITTWEIPFRKITARASLQHYRDAVDIMHIFAFMHFESIPENIFQAFWNSVNGTEHNLVDYPDILQNKPMFNEEAQARIRRAFRVLCDYSIIDYDPDKGFCSLHPVIHTWARNRLALPDYKYWLSCTTAMLAHCISSNLEASGRQFRSQLLSHIDSCHRASQSLLPSFPESLKQATEVEKFASVYAENGLWTQARGLQRKVIVLRVKMLGKRNKDTLQAQKNLGEIYWNLFDVKSCIEIQVQILKSRFWTRPSLSYWIRWPPWRPDHVTYCVALSDLTQSLWLAGENSLSKRAGERAVEGLMKHLGPNDPMTLNAMFNLGRTYHHLRDYKKSHKYLVWVLRKRKRFFGPNHPDTLMARTELGISYRALGRMELAERLVKNALEVRKKTLGEEHAYTLWSVNELSKILCDRGRSAEAVSMLEEIIPIVIRTLGETHVGMTMTRSNLARAYALNKRWDDATITLQNVLSIVHVDHPDWIQVMCGYIHVRVKIGRFEETEKDCDTVLNHITDKKRLPLDDPRTLGIAETLQRIYKAQGRINEISVLKRRVPGLKEQDDSQESLFSMIYGAYSDDGNSKPRITF